MFHQLIGMDSVDLPRQFTYPFLYTPHPLALKAKELLVSYLSERTEWKEEIDHGKMFGVLVVQNAEGTLGYLAAFSGQLAGSFLHPYFVPPIYDLNAKKSFFREEEKKITQVNERITSFQNSEEYVSLSEQIRERQTDWKVLQTQWKERLSNEKALRDQKRIAGITQEEEAELIKQSQFLKAQYRREKCALESEIEELKTRLSAMEQQLVEWKERRKEMSAELQRRLFEQFRICNAKGETCSLLELFQPLIPPSGAGECALPKLLQYAFQHQMVPLCMTEFWMGRSPKSIVRRNGDCYPSCNAKCKPILTFMLQGLDVEPNPLEEKVLLQSIPLVWEDDELLIVNKPSGMLSVKGKLDVLSVEELMQRQYPDLSIKAVHRLDQATSGILVLAKNEETFVAMQSLFSHRQVQKRYLALLEGLVKEDRGEVDLPLCLDVTNRPCQMVSYEYGKTAKTTYEVLERKDGRTCVFFYPHTGRTHQLRVHAAHSLGLGCPIVGDTLYGHAADRLYLQAQRIEFLHPKTGKLVVVELPRDF